MAASGLRRLTERERERVGEFAAQHGKVLGFALPIADDDGNVSMPAIRVSVLARLQHRGAISAGEAAAGETFHRLFRIATLDPLKAADMARTPGGKSAGDLPPSAEQCRRRVADAMAALGGAGSPAASAIWHICGLEQTVRQWSLATRRPQTLACGILIGALAALAAHFAGGRRALTQPAIRSAPPRL